MRRVTGRAASYHQAGDTRRYATIRSGAYRPKIERFSVGDYVYVLLRNRTSTLQLPTKGNVLRVVELSPSGVTTLLGRCGTEHKEHVSNLAPCHLPNL